MASIPRSLIDEYTRQLNLVSDGMKEALAKELELIDWTDMAAAKARVLEIMQVYCGGATDAAALLASRFYETVRGIEVGGEFSALVDSGRIPEATVEAVESFFGAKTATPEKIREQLLSRLGFEVKRAAGDCIFENGRRDKAKPSYARVPSGSDTCDFCLMLAGRGFVYRNKVAAGFLNHYHDNCDCRVVPSWKGGGVEGYHPAKIAQQWSDNIWAKAEARAQASGRTAEEEHAAIIRQLEEGANRAKGRRAAGL